MEEWKAAKASQMTDVKCTGKRKWGDFREKVISVCSCAGRKSAFVKYSVWWKTYRSKLPSLERGGEGRRSREEEEKAAAIEVLDKSHEAGDHFNREVSAVKLCVGLSGLSLFLKCVGVYCTHLIASSIPVALAGGAPVSTPQGYYFRSEGRRLVW